MTKTIMSIDYATRTRKPLASFTLAKGQVVAAYQSPKFERAMEATGIFIMLGKEMVTLWPTDGKVFWDNLEKAYANSSTLAVVKSR